MAVDHDERRRRIAEVAIDIIAREGLDAATIRRIASEIGASLRAITHYFADKDELLLAAYRIMALQGERRVRDAVSHDPADLVGGLTAMTAADDGAFQHWRVYVSFWDRAARDPVFAAEQRVWIEHARRRVVGMIEAGHGARSDAPGIAMQLLAFVQGVSVQRLCDPSSWSRAEIEAALRRQVAALLGPPPSSSRT